MCTQHELLDSKDKLLKHVVVAHCTNGVGICAASISTTIHNLLRHPSLRPHYDHLFSKVSEVSSLQLISLGWVESVRTTAILWDLQTFRDDPKNPQASVEAAQVLVEKALQGVTEARIAWHYPSCPPNSAYYSSSSGPNVQGIEYAGGTNPANILEDNYQYQNAIEEDFATPDVFPMQPPVAPFVEHFPARQWIPGQLGGFEQTTSFHQVLSTPWQTTSPQVHFSNPMGAYGTAGEMHSQLHGPQYIQPFQGHFNQAWPSDLGQPTHQSSLLDGQSMNGPYHAAESSHFQSGTGLAAAAPTTSVSGSPSRPLNPAARPFIGSHGRADGGT
jgi:hypothetical protein